MAKKSPKGPARTFKIILGIIGLPFLPFIWLMEIAMKSKVKKHGR